MRVSRFERNEKERKISYKGGGAVFQSRAKGAGKMSFKIIAPLCLAATLLFYSFEAMASGGLDSAPGIDLPISSGGKLAMTICGTGPDSHCPPGYGGYIVYGPNPAAPTAWINPATGESSFSATGGGTCSLSEWELANYGCPAGSYLFQVMNVCGEGGCGGARTDNHCRFFDPKTPSTTTCYTP
jgi:hypothetical protein